MPRYREMNGTLTEIYNGLKMFFQQMWMILLHEEYENFDGYLDENDGESDIDDEEDYLTQKD